MSVITGSKDAFLQPSEYGRTEAGQYSTLPYESVDPNIINTLALQFDRLGYRYRVQHNFGKHRLEVFLSYNNAVSPEVPVDLWELDYQIAQKDILDSTVPSGVTKTLTAKQKVALRAVLRDHPNIDFSQSPNLSNDFTLPAAWINVFGVQDPTLNDDTANCAAMYALVADGADTFEEAVPIVAHVVTCSKDFSITMNLDNVGLILTHEKFLQEGSIPSQITDNLIKFTDDDPVKKYGWKKGYPTVQQSAYQKVQGRQQYIFGKWDTRIFGNLIKPT